MLVLRPALQRAVTCAGGSCVGGGGGERLLLLQSPVGYTATQVDQGRMLTITEGAIAPGPPTHAPMESSYRTHASERVAKARLQKGLGKARRRATAYQLRLCVSWLKEEFFHATRMTYKDVTKSTKVRRTR